MQTGTLPTTVLLCPHHFLNFWLLFLSPLAAEVTLRNMLVTTPGHSELLVLVVPRKRRGSWAALVMEF